MTNLFANKPAARLERRRRASLASWRTKYIPNRRTIQYTRSQESRRGGGTNDRSVQTARPRREWMMREDEDRVCDCDRERFVYVELLRTSCDGVWLSAVCFVG